MSIRQRKNGSWEVRYRDPEGVHRSKSFRRKADAVAFENSTLHSIYTGIYQQPIHKKITVGEIFNEYLKSKRGLKPKSIEEINTIWNHIISPTFAKTQASSINSERIHKWIDDLVFSEYAKTSAYRMNKALGYFSRMMDYAIELGYLAKNPCLKPNGKQIKVKTTGTNNVRLTRALTQDELLKLANACGEFRDMVLLMGLCGLRWAEVVGLKVGDFSLDSNKLTITRTLSEINGIFHETTTKTGKERIIFIPPTVARMINKRNRFKNKDDLVFSNERGNPLHNSNFRNRVYLPAIQQSQVPKVTIHDLRHTAASIAIGKGADIVTVSQMLGHTDTSMTLRKYSHYYERNMIALSKDLDRFFTAS